MIKDADEEYPISTQELILELFMDTDKILKKIKYQTRKQK